MPLCCATRRIDSPGSACTVFVFPFAEWKWIVTNPLSMILIPSQCHLDSSGLATVDSVLKASIVDSKNERKRRTENAPI